MNEMIILPFIIPAVVFIFLITLLVQERYAFIPKKRKAEYVKNKSGPENNKQKINEDKAQEPWDNYLDLSGGAFGI